MYHFYWLYSAFSKDARTAVVRMICVYRLIPEFPLGSFSCDVGHIHCCLLG